MYTYIYFFLQNKNTEISHKAPTMGIKLEKIISGSYAI